MSDRKDVPIEHRAEEIRNIAFRVHDRLLEAAALKPEAVLAFAGALVLRLPSGESGTDWFIAGQQDELAAALLTALSEDFGIDLQQAADIQAAMR